MATSITAGMTADEYAAFCMGTAITEARVHRAAWRNARRQGWESAGTYLRCAIERIQHARYMRDRIRARRIEAVPVEPQAREEWLDRVLPVGAAA